jgi:predicted amidohydrolase YtcJ
MVLKDGRFRLEIYTMVLLATLMALITGGCSMTRALSAPPKSAVYLNGTILTMDSKNSIVEAMAVARDRIEAVGSQADIKPYIHSGTVVIDLQGKTLMPGFVDAHSHFPGSGLAAVGVDLNSPPIGRIETIAQAVKELRQRANTAKPGKWIVGFGFDDTMIKDKRHLNRTDLDQVSTAHPIYIMHITGHFGAVNSLALKQLGITADTPNPQGGIIQKDPTTREPTGLLEETAKDKALQTALQFSFSDRLAVIRYAVNDYAGHGVTTAQNGWASLSILKALSLMSKLGFIPQRLIVWPDAQEVSDKILTGDFKPDKYRTDKFNIGAVKLFADGSIQGFTGYLSQPYFTPYHGDASYRGYPTHKPEELTTLITKYHKAGLQIAIHDNGDAAIDDVLSAFAEAQKAFPRQDPRHICVHAQTVRDDQLDRMQSLGITPSYHLIHPYYWGDRHRSIFLGPERTSRISPAKTTITKGIRFSTHLDTPVVPMDPLLLVWCAVNRISTGGEVIGPEQRILPMEALRSVTIDAAWQAFQEDNRGSLEKGKYADLVILDGNPLTNPSGIKDIQVVETIVGGKTIYKQGQ